MKNNKGFSLVELIIVIAIMAILVGVMAPQLIKYIEKTNVSSDTQLCDTVKTAITNAMMDPSVIASDAAGIQGLSSSGADVSTLGGSTDDTTVKGAIAETLGFDPANIDSHLKSSAARNNGKVQYMVAGANSVHVWVTNSDNTGKKSQYNKGNAKCIYVD